MRYRCTILDNSLFPLDVAPPTQRMWYGGLDSGSSVFSDGSLWPVPHREPLPTSRFTQLLMSAEPAGKKRAETPYQGVGLARFWVRETEEVVTQFE